MSKYTFNPPYNHWSGNRSDTLNKWKINYKGSIAKASDLPNEGEFKGDTYNVLEDGSNYMWNGSSWDKLDANIYIGATSSKNGIQGLVPPALSSERNMFLKGDGTYGIPAAGLTDINLEFSCDRWTEDRRSITVEYYSDSNTYIGSSEGIGTTYNIRNATAYIYIVFDITTNVTTGTTIKNYVSEKIYVNEIVENKVFGFTKDENSTSKFPASYYEGEIHNVEGTSFKVSLYRKIPFSLQCDLYNEDTIVNSYTIDMSCIADYINTAITGAMNG